MSTEYGDLIARDFYARQLFFSDDENILPSCLCKSEIIDDNGVYEILCSNNSGTEYSTIASLSQNSVDLYASLMLYSGGISYSNMENDDNLSCTWYIDNLTFTSPIYYKNLSSTISSPYELNGIVYRHGNMIQVTLTIQTLSSVITLPNTDYTLNTTILTSSNFLSYKPVYGEIMSSMLKISYNGTDELAIASLDANGNLNLYRNNLQSFSSSINSISFYSTSTFTFTYTK
jgi:hypothetical protein